jgi:hypothetical protein
MVTAPAVPEYVRIPQAPAQHILPLYIGAPDDASHLRLQVLTGNRVLQ